MAFAKKLNTKFTDEYLKATFFKPAVMKFVYAVGAAASRNNPVVEAAVLESLKVGLKIWIGPAGKPTADVIKAVNTKMKNYPEIKTAIFETLYASFSRPGAMPQLFQDMFDRPDLRPYFKDLEKTFLKDIAKIYGLGVVAEGLAKPAAKNAAAFSKEFGGKMITLLSLTDSTTHLFKLTKLHSPGVADISHFRQDASGLTLLGTKTYDYSVNITNLLKS
jgi:hypothetical protein